MPADPVTIERLKAKFGDVTVSEFRGQTRVVILKEQLADCFQVLRHDRAFDMLIDVTCVDYLAYREERPARFGLVYLFCNTESGERLAVRVFLDEPDLSVPSAVPVWEGANWLEREVYDLFGIDFAGHPDLRRIVLPDEFAAHPLRKDYPLQGRGERHNFPVITRNRS